MALFRQIGMLLVLAFVFFAAIAAVSRVLKMDKVDGYISTSLFGLSSLFKGVYQK